MNTGPRTESGARHVPNGSRRWLWLFVAGGVAVILGGMLLSYTDRHVQPTEDGPTPTITKSPSAGEIRAQHASGQRDATLAAEAIVTNKVAQFADRRRELVHEMATHLKVSVPDGYEEPTVRIWNT
jgi:hypothetical protein